MYIPQDTINLLEYVYTEIRPSIIYNEITHSSFLEDRDCKLKITFYRTVFYIVKTLQHPVKLRYRFTFDGEFYYQEREYLGEGDVTKKTGPKRRLDAKTDKEFQDYILARF